MFVSRDARDLLRTGRQDSFFAEVVDPMIREAQAIGVPLKDVVSHIEKAEKGGAE
jgi:DNA-binding transcriptional regulator YhcF (GntR family)